MCIRSIIIIINQQSLNMKRSFASTKEQSDDEAEHDSFERLHKRARLLSKTQPSDMELIMTHTHQHNNSQFAQILITFFTTISSILVEYIDIITINNLIKCSLFSHSCLNINLNSDAILPLKPRIANYINNNSVFYRINKYKQPIWNQHKDIQFQQIRFKIIYNNTTLNDSDRSINILTTNNDKLIPFAQKLINIQF